MDDKETIPLRFTQGKRENDLHIIPNISPLSPNGRILAGEHYDPVKQETFYRPIGGGIEFGEHSRDTMVREAREELGASVVNLRLLATLENRFIFNGQAGHEIVQVYDGEFVDRTLYQPPTLTGIEDGASFTAVWKPLSDFLGENAPPLYPDGLLDLLIGRG